VGWDSCRHWRTKADVIADILDGAQRAGREVLAHHSARGAFYTVQRSPLTENGPVTNWIGVYLIERQGGEWCLKEMSEGCGPYAHDCPLRFLNMAPVDGEYGAAWRERVRAYHAQKAERRAGR
jgi:hypothetical protein